MKETVVVLSFLIVKLTLFATVSCHQAVNPLKDAGASAHQHQHPHEQVHQQQQREAVQRGTQHQPAGRGIDRNAVHDQEHIMEHLDGKIAKPKEEMTEEELQFHYFKVHDYNNDNKLDGIELISALTHHNAESRDKSKLESERMPDSELAQIVDGILDDNDGNRDGFIDYPEFLLTQRQ